MKFASGGQMLDYINDNHDLYSPSQEIYIFNYNDAGSVCTYDIDKDEATKLARQCREESQYWSALLGWGGLIYDDPSYDAYDPNKMNNLEICECLKDADDWCECSAWLEQS